MEKLIEAIFTVTAPKLLVLAGLMFLLIAVVGKIAGKIESDKGGRIAAGIVGAVLLVAGLVLQTTNSPESSPTPVAVDTTPAPANPAPTRPKSTPPPAKTPSKTDPPEPVKGDRGGARFRVVEATLSVSPSTYEGPCPKMITFEGTIRVAGSNGSLQYQFVRSDGVSSRPAALEFNNVDSKEVRTTWTLGRPDASRRFIGWQAIQIIEPQRLDSNQATFNINCISETNSSANQLSNVRMTRQDNYVNVMVDYVYDGSMGTGAYLTAMALDSSGQRVGGNSLPVRRNPISSGRGTITARFGFGNGNVQDIRTIRICMSATGNLSPFCRNFPYVER